MVGGTIAPLACTKYDNFYGSGNQCSDDYDFDLLLSTSARRGEFEYVVGMCKELLLALLFIRPSNSTTQLSGVENICQ